MEGIRELSQKCFEKDKKIKELEAKIEMLTKDHTEEKKKMNDMNAKLERIGTEGKARIKKMNQKIIGKSNLELQNKILNESKTISQNLLLQKEMKNDLMKQKTYIMNLEEKIRGMDQEINVSR